MLNPSNALCREYQCSMGCHGPQRLWDIISWCSVPLQEAATSLNGHRGAWPEVYIDVRTKEVLYIKLSSSRIYPESPHLRSLACIGPDVKNWLFIQSLGHVE